MTPWQAKQAGVLGKAEPMSKEPKPPPEAEVVTKKKTKKKAKRKAKKKT